MSPTSATRNDSIRLPFNFDVAKMAAEIETLRPDNFNYYDVMPLRAPAFKVDPSIPMPPPAEDYADGTWTDWLDTSSLTNSPYLSSVVDTFKARTRVTLVRLLRLAPGAVVKEHTDPTLGLEVHQSVIRLTIPIVTNEEVKFFLNDQLVPMKAGECWYLRLTDPHRIVNGSSTERINLTIDMEPNEWVTKMILAAEG